MFSSSNYVYNYFQFNYANYSTIFCLLQFSAERFRPPQLESAIAI